jgi:two-component system nitrogen regulation response regulator GlnG
MSRGRVLLLEDDAALRGLLQEALGTEGFEVLSFDSYVGIRDEASRGAADLILADFWGRGHRRLTDSDREEILELSGLLPVILLTGRTWAAETNADELGARALIRKPFDLDALITAVKRALQRADS